MRKRRRNAHDSAIALEICHSEIRLVICRLNGDRVNIHTQSVRWGQDAVTLNSEAGAEQLKRALRQLAEENGLENQVVHAALSGDYCVTRVVTGTEERVEQELEQLEERSHLYLSLGPGRKALGGAIRQIDARHQHALLSVVNERTLDLLMDIGESLNIEFALVEPSLSAIARFLGACGGDAQGPTLIINALRAGFEVGISHKGQLLLDYRPTGALTAAELATTLTHHLGRLQRYCDRYVRFTDGRLENVVLAGAEDRVQELRAAIEEIGVLKPEILKPKNAIDEWTFQAAHVPSNFASTLGVAMLGLPDAEESEAPDLLAQLDARMLGPLLPATFRAFWPIAAAAALVAVCWLGVSRAQNRCNHLEMQLASFLPDQQEAREVAVNLAHDRNLLGIHQEVAVGLTGPRWNELTSIITQCLPDDAWLEEITGGANGMVELKGNSYSESGVFRFRGWLRKYPGFSQVILNETQDSHGLDLRAMESVAGSKRKHKAATRFDIQCRLAGQKGNFDDGGI